jgi:hypothetical protein
MSLARFGSAQDALFLHNHDLCRLCENLDAKSSNPIFVQLWPVLSDQKAANRENWL